MRRSIVAGLLLGVRAAAAAEAVTIELTLRDGLIAPATAEVPAGAKVRILLRNAGRGPCEFESTDLHVEKVLAPGASSFVVVHKARAGSHRFFDEFNPGRGEFVLVVK
ncbi:MAG: cupredoxin domain-containing protein [Gammaproteobacteria bacterium]|nr:cupredoxin domain-containing protein [Gammaproteobacteria bacterium]